MTIGKWLSAALDDPDVCEEMKADVRYWLDAVPDDRQIADVVNRLRDIAVEFHAAQQLRERIVGQIVPLLRSLQ